MIIEQLYTGCPGRSGLLYWKRWRGRHYRPAARNGAIPQFSAKRHSKIKYVLETHFHADFVSGHIDLGQKQGCKCLWAYQYANRFEAHIAHDGEELALGKIKIKVLPGTHDGKLLLSLLDENGNETALFSGDTLFIGDVGRPILPKSNCWTNPGKSLLAIFTSRCGIK